jgi:glyceraldehyde-3-phosphate dehydrogenase/erythrose-4-phosphate dehydrogenase
MKTWKDQISGCFGDKDLVFAGHQADEERARKMLKAAIDQKATMADIVAEATKFLKSKNARVRHIQREVKKIRILDF